MSRIFKLYRGIFVLSVGLLILLGVTAIILFSVKNYDPKTLSLAFRVDAEKTLLFFRTDDKARFERFLDFADPYLTDAPRPDPAALPPAISYEFALLKSGSGSKWAIYSHLREGKHVTLLSAEDPQIFLPIGKIGASLAKTGLFSRHINSESKNVLWFDFSLPLAPPSDALAIISSALDRYVSALVIFDRPQSTAFLEKKSAVSGYSAGPALKTFVWADKPSLEIRSPRPAPNLSHLAKALNKINPELFEGLNGVFEEFKEKLSDFDPDRNPDNLLKNGITAAVFQENETAPVLMVSGTFGNRGEANRWLKSLSERNDSGVIREQIFMNENGRTDIIAGTGSIQNEAAAFGWSISKIRYPDASFVIALKNKSYVLSTDEGKLKKILETQGNGEFKRSLPGGTMDLAWLLDTLDREMSFLAKDTGIISARIFGTETGRINWEISEESRVTEIKLNLEP